MKDILKVAVIGCGYWGPNIIRNFETLSDSRVAICCDIDKEKLENIKDKYTQIKTTQDPHSVFQDLKIDAVAIVTPPKTHYKLAKEALSHNKHVLVEKPLSTSSVEADELIHLAEQKNRILMVDHTFIFSSPVEEIRKLIKTESLGKLYRVDFSWLNLGLFQEDNVLWDILPHLVSILLFVLNKKPFKVNGYGTGSIKKDLTDTANLVWQFEDDTIVTANLSWLWPEKVRRAVFVGSNKMLIYDDLKVFNKLTLLDKGVSFRSKKNKYQYREGAVFTPKLKIKEPLGKVCAHFIESIKKGKITKSDGQFGLQVVKIIEEAHKALNIL